ncbi:hypothetical protein IJ768_03555 [Candidatus Saccharibacteria bacterium]|nr:hypothetical protein [Candidatus Saccharibacteria bacterium]
MGHDENTNDFNASGNPLEKPENVAPNPRAQLGNNRIGMHKSRTFSAQDELNRISADSNSNVIAPSGTGDVVLNSAKPKKNKKIIVLVVLVVLVVVTVIAIVASLIVTKGGVIGGGNDNNGSKSKLAEATKNHFDRVIELESMVRSIKEGRTTAENTFTEDVKKILDDDYSAFNSFKNAVKAFADDDNSVPEVNSLLDKMNQVEPGYNAFIEIYDDYYKAFTSHDKTFIEKYLSKGGSVKEATEAYIEYIDNYDAIQENKELIETQNCMEQNKLNAQQIQNCNTIINSDMTYEKVLRNGEYFRAIFNEAVNDIIITKDDSMSSRIILLKGYLEI